MEINATRHTGRLPQTIIYLGKLFRMFIFQTDWKVLPMAAIIAGLISFAVGNNLFVTMEGTLTGTFAVSCICIWNGFFNSIQSICRERAIIKREHRAGMHITSYVGAHVIYQAFLCACQALITAVVCSVAGVKYPEVANLTLADNYGSVSVNFFAALVIILFLVTYTADLMALMISAIVHTQMAAMTVMPFVLIMVGVLFLVAFVPGASMLFLK